MVIVNEDRHRTIDSAIIWIIALSCIFLQYHAVIVSCGEFLLLFGFFIVLATRKHFFVDRSLLALVVVMIVHQIVVSFVLKIGVIITVTHILFYLLLPFIVSLGGNITNRDMFYNKCRIVGCVCSVVVFIQFVIIHLTGKTVNAIRIMPVSEDMLSAWNQNTVQPSGFFSEPQTFCSYMIPLLIVSVEKKDYKFAGILTIALGLSGSSLGILTVILIWALEIISVYNISISKVFVALLIGIVVFLVIRSGAVDESIEKIVNIFKEFSSYRQGKLVGEHSLSNYMRTMKGWDTYKEMPLLFQILGVGRHGFQNYIEITDMRFSWSHLFAEGSSRAFYFSSAAGVFIEYGLIVGLIYYVYFIKKVVSNNRMCTKIIAFMLLQSLFTQISFNGIFIFYLLFVAVYSDYTKEAITLKM